jgi:hypothetical protein
MIQADTVIFGKLPNLRRSDFSTYYLISGDIHARAGRQCPLTERAA